MSDTLPNTITPDTINNRYILNKAWLDLHLWNISKNEKFIANARSEVEKVIARLNNEIQVDPQKFEDVSKVYQKIEEAINQAKVGVLEKSRAFSLTWIATRIFWEKFVKNVSKRPWGDV